MEITKSQTQSKAVARKKRIPIEKRERRAWYLYDFGNSAYAAVVLLAVYSAYFKGTVVGGAEGSRLWGLSVGIAMLIVGLTSPILGALADSSQTKKRILLVFTVMASFFTAMLFFVGPGDIAKGMIFFILAEIGYRNGQVFYNALLPDIAEPEEMSRVSGNGWAIGSAGGIVCLLIVLALILGIGGQTVIRVAFLITAVFYAASTAPLFFLVKERTEPKPLPRGENYFSISIKRLWETFKAARKYQSFARFLGAFLVFNNGIMITLDFAAIIGATLFGLDQTQLIVFMIIVQVTSVIGAFVFGRAAGRWGSKAILVVALILMTLTVSLLYFTHSLTMFNIVGALAGFALTGVQSVSRTAVGQIAPEEKAAEFYGLFSLASQLSNFIGPTLFGLLIVWFTNFYAGKGMEVLPAEQSGLMLAIASILVFLVAGMALLFTVRVWHRVDEEA
ncbi:MAG TPA: MFS transporter [Anaerolineaceae bacterium]|jgi:UMF1 family MFS transporter|nr:MFS transporter [Anaerolineaceae bacterium]HQF46223.1 MFS transporter [Anaerolineaceae bacterium]HQH36365.1 MFS transporter [Anaerolineaceae bacterium]